MPNPEMIDQVSSLFEMFAQYFDRRFFELQEFMYHFNKSVGVINRNFHSLSLSGGQIEQVQPYKARKEEKRLSADIREHIMLMRDIAAATAPRKRSTQTKMNA